MEQPKLDKITNEHIRELLTKIEYDGNMTHQLRGRIMVAMHYLARNIQIEVELQMKNKPNPLKGAFLEPRS